jgi:hypothetical protein
MTTGGKTHRRGRDQQDDDRVLHVFVHDGPEALGLRLLKLVGAKDFAVLLDRGGAVAGRLQPIRQIGAQRLGQARHAAVLLQRVQVLVLRGGAAAAAEGGGGGGRSAGGTAAAAGQGTCQEGSRARAAAGVASPVLAAGAQGGCARSAGRRGGCGAAARERLEVARIVCDKRGRVRTAFMSSSSWQLMAYGPTGTLGASTSVAASFSTTAGSASSAMASRPERHDESPTVAVR